MLEGLELVFVQAQRLAHQRIPLDELGRGETGRKARAHRMILDEMDDGVDATVQGSVVRTVGGAEILTPGQLAVARHVQGVLDELGYPLALCSGNGHHRDAEHALEAVHVDGAAVRGHLVHHVESEHHGTVELHELQGEVEIALDVGRVDDVDDGVGFLPENEPTAHDLLAGIRGERVNPGQIRDSHIVVPQYAAVLAVDGHPGKVADMLVRTGELVEQGRLTAILVAGKREPQRLVGRGALPACARPTDALSDGGMFGCRRGGILTRGVMGIVHVDELDARGIGEAQRQLVITKPNLHRIAHGGVLHHGDLRARGQTHVQDMLIQRRVIGVDRCHDGVLADLKLVEPHIAQSPHVRIAPMRPMADQPQRAAKFQQPSYYPRMQTMSRMANFPYWPHPTGGRTIRHDKAPSKGGHPPRRASARWAAPPRPDAPPGRRPRPA